MQGQRKLCSNFNVFNLICFIWLISWSVKPTEISKLIHELEKIEIKPSMIQPIKDIKSLGKFKVKIYLHSEVDAEININVESAEAIQ